MRCDVAKPEHVLLAERRIIPSRGRCFPAIPPPHHHIVHGARRPVAIQHLQRQFLWRELLLHALQRQSDIALHHAFASAVTGERPANKIIRPRVADILNDGRIDVAQGHKASGQGLRGSRRSNQGGGQDHHNCFHESRSFEW